MEYRSVFLGYFPQGDQKRFYHLGLDVTAPAQTPIHAPLDGIVFQSGHEEGEGNYGGFVVLQHERKDDAPLYSFYGHLDKNSQPIVGQKIQKGECLLGSETWIPMGIGFTTFIFNCSRRGVSTRAGWNAELYEGAACDYS